MRNARRRLLPLLLLLALPLFAACSVSTQPDQVALLYNDGPFSPRTFDKCIGVSTREAQGPSDTWFAYPANQRIFDFTGLQGADQVPFGFDGTPAVVTSDGIRFDGVPGALQFNLETDCDTLRSFHDKIGLRYAAYFEGTESEGWSRNVLPKYIAAPLASALAETASNYTWRDLYTDAGTRETWRRETEELLPLKVGNATEGDEQFFKGFALNLQVPDLPDALKAAIDGEQKAVADAQAAQSKGVADAAAAKAKADAEVSQAQAETLLEQERSKQEAARLAPYGGPVEYNKAKAIEKGLNPYHPTIQIPGVQVPQN